MSHSHPAPALAATRPWRSYTHVLRARFGRRVYKIGLDAGFTCPNLDGTLARGGCTYCHNAAFSPGTRQGRPPLTEQIARARAALRRRYKAEAFIAYFQAYTNTYGRSVEELRTLYNEALAGDDMVGLAVATRPDCVTDAVLDLLAEYVPTHDVMLELGLQTVHDRTQARTNRWHTFAHFTDAVARAQARGLPLCVHLMLGMPGETRADMLATADAVAPLGIAAVKIHLTHVVKGTALARDYASGAFVPLERDAYVRLVADVLERLPADMAVERLTGEAPPDFHVAPAWAQDKQGCLDGIAAELHARGMRQGARFAPAAVA